MTKRTKLLSVMVAAVLCLVAGFAIMFGSNKTASADVVLPTVEETTVEEISITAKNSEAWVANKVAAPADADWIIFEWTNGAENHYDNMNSQAVFHGAATTNPSASRHTTNAGWTDFYAFNAKGETIKYYFSLADGKIYWTKSSDPATVNTSGAAVTIPADREAGVYVAFCIHNPIVRVDMIDLKCYTEDGVDLGVQHNFVDLFDAPSVVAGFFDQNTVEANNSSNWPHLPRAQFTHDTGVEVGEKIVLEYTIPSNTTVTAPGNGLIVSLRNSIGATYKNDNDATGNVYSTAYMGANASLINSLFANTTADPLTVKVLFDTETGFVWVKRGAAPYSFTLDLSANISNITNMPADQKVYAGITMNGASFQTNEETPVNKDLYLTNVRAYDLNAKNLAVRVSHPDNYSIIGAFTKTSTGTEFIIGADMSDVKAYMYKGVGATDIRNNLPTTAEWIIFEWENGNSLVNAAVGGSHYSYINTVDAGSASNKREPGLVACFNNDNSTMINAYTAGRTTKIMFNTKTGEKWLKYGDAAWVKSAYLTGGQEANLGAANAGEDGGYWAGFVANNGVSSIEMKNLKCYDSNGKDLGVKKGSTVITQEDVTSCLDDINTSGIVGKDLVAKGNGAATYVAAATGTENEWIIFDWTNGSTNAINTNQGGHSFAYNISSEQSTGFNVSGYVHHSCVAWFVANKTAKLYFNVRTAEIFYALDGGVAEKITGHSLTPVAVGGTGYANIYFNTDLTAGTMENLKIYDEKGNDLGVLSNMLTNGTIAEDYFNIMVGNDHSRWQGHVTYVTSTGEPAANACIGAIPALKTGTEEVTLTFITGGGSLQLFYAADNGYGGFEGVDDWYLVEEGTVFGSVILTEDVIFVIKGSNMHLFKATKEFAITYAGVDGKENPNTTTTRTFDEAVTITAIDDPLFNGWDVTEIPAYTFGDVTVTANWVEAQWIDYNLTISEDLSLSFNVRNVGSVSLTAIFTMDIDGENKIEETVSMRHYANEIPGKIIYVNFTFDKILPQHLGDNINVKIMYGDIQMLEMDVTVKEYLDGIIAGDTASEEEKALAQDLLYYGAAAQLYTGHDVDNLPADLDGVSADLPEDLSVYAKDGVKDAEYYWKKAEVVYDNTVSLVLTFAAPADLDTLVVTVVNAGVSTDVVAEQVSAGIYEVSIALPATQFGNALTLTIKDGGEAKGQVLTYSVNSYIAEVETADTAYITLLERLYCYGASANKFANLDA